MQFVNQNNSPLQSSNLGKDEGLQHLQCMLIELRNQEIIEFSCGGRESAFYCVRGSCNITVSGEKSTIRKGEAFYVAPNERIVVHASEDVSAIYASADVTGNYQSKIIKPEDILDLPHLHFKICQPNATRTVSILIGANVDAGRLIMGRTESEPGHWTSWPPHKHENMLEEVYVFVDMPSPAFGLQTLYGGNNKNNSTQIVREGDSLVVGRGYHPNCAAPGYCLNYIWIMAALREKEDRIFGVVELDPTFGFTESGLEVSHDYSTAK